MNTGYISIYLCLLQFISSMFYTFQCTEFSPSWLNSKCFILFDAFINGIVYLISFLDRSLLIYGSTTGFCMLLVSWSFTEFVRSNSFEECLWGFIYKRSNHLEKETVLLLHFWFECFFNFSCLITLARTSSTTLNRSGKSRHSVLLLILEEKLLVFHHWVWS